MSNADCDNTPAEKDRGKEGEEEEEEEKQRETRREEEDYGMVQVMRV